MKAQDETKEGRRGTDGGGTHEAANAWHDAAWREPDAGPPARSSRRNFPAPRFVNLWNLAAGLCLCAALIFWWRALADAAFVAAALGVVAWFLNVRSQFKRTRDEGAGDDLEDVDESERVNDVYES